MANDLLKRWPALRRRVLAGMYAAALLPVVVLTLWGPLMQALGLWREQALCPADFTGVGIEVVDDATLETATDDAQLHYTADGMHSLWVRCSFSTDPGEFVLFYQNRMEAEFDARKELYARRYGDWYVFPLPAGTRKIRLDLGVLPSVKVHFDEIILNRRTPPMLDTEALVWAAVLPGLLFEVLDWLLELAAAEGRNVGRAARLLRWKHKQKGRPPMTVTKDTIIADILQNDPLRESVAIFLSCGMHCLGCIAAHGETVAEACEVHGVDPAPLIDELNAYFAKLAG